jgi:hypothetical protein
VADLVLFSSALLLAAVLTYVGGPLLGPPHGLDDAGGAPEREHRVSALGQRKAMLYQSIRDAELDRQTGKLSEEDYREMVDGLKREAASVIRDLDRAAAAPAGSRG